MGRTARGVRGIELRGNDRVVDMVVIQHGMSVLTVCERGYGKRTDIDAYRLTHRGGKGVINIRVSERNGPVVALRAVTDDDELMLISAKGILLRTSLERVREIGRATQGVRLIRVEADDRVVAVAKVVTEAQQAAVAGETAESPPSEATPASDRADATDSARPVPSPPESPPDESEPDRDIDEPPGAEQSGS